MADRTRRLTLALVLCAILAFCPTAEVRAEAPICALVECRGDFIDAGLLTGSWVEACHKSHIEARRSCIENSGDPAKISRCLHVCDADSWPTNENFDKSPHRIALERARKRAESVDVTKANSVRAAMRRKLLDILQKAGRYEQKSGAALLANAFAVDRAYRGSIEALDVSNKLLRKAGGEFDAYSPEKRKQWAETMYSLLMSAMTFSDDAAGLQNARVREAAIVVDDLSGLGIDIASFKNASVNGERGVATLRFFERIARGARAVSSASDLKAKDEQSARKFAQDWLRLLPAKAAPGYSGPASALVEDIVVWDAKMFDASTDGLATVRDAMKTGKLDQARVTQFENYLNDLKKGPFTRDTLKRTVQEYVEDLPVLGKIADFMFHD